MAYLGVSSSPVVACTTTSAKISVCREADLADVETSTFDYDLLAVVTSVCSPVLQPVYVARLACLYSRGPIYKISYDNLTIILL